MRAALPDERLASRTSGRRSTAYMTTAEPAAATIPVASRGSRSGTTQKNTRTPTTAARMPPRETVRPTQSTTMGSAPAANALPASVRASVATYRSKGSPSAANSPVASE